MLNEGDSNHEATHTGIPKQVGGVRLESLCMAIWGEEV